MATNNKTYHYHSLVPKNVTGPNDKSVYQSINLSPSKSGVGHELIIFSYKSGCFGIAGSSFF